LINVFLKKYFFDKIKKIKKLYIYFFLKKKKEKKFGVAPWPFGGGQPRQKG
jgi:hypothetical protein